MESFVSCDVPGDPVDIIASGPVSADPSTCAQAVEIAEKYGLLISGPMERCLRTETPKTIRNVHAQVIGSVRELCRAAEAKARELGYHPVVLSDRLSGEASETGKSIAFLLREKADTGTATAYIAGGETVEHVRGNGLGRRNQELVLAAAGVLSGIPNVVIISVSSDGTDGPTDAAGDSADGDTLAAIKKRGLDARIALSNDDSYRDARTYAADPWILNYTNPAAIVAAALDRVFPGDRKIVNMCDQPVNLLESFAKVLGMDRHDLVPEYVGRFFRRKKCSAISALMAAVRIFCSLQLTDGIFIIVIFRRTCSPRGMILTTKARSIFSD